MSQIDQYSSGMNRTMELNRDHARALHEQLSDRVRAELVKARRPGDQIPTEEEIGRIYGLSRVTVRRAIQTLVDQGVLIRRQGKGTFVAQPKPHIVYEIDRFGPFIAAFAASGESVSAKLLDFAWVTGPEVPAGLGPQGSALVYERLYETDGTPHASLRIALPANLGKNVSREDAASMGIYQILQEKLGVNPVRASFEIGTQLPNALLAQRLRISPTTPLLLLERVTYDNNDSVLEHTVHYLLPEVYKLSVNVKKPLSPGAR